jgi:hypothetical protein
MLWKQHGNGESGVRRHEKKVYYLRGVDIMKEIKHKAFHDEEMRYNASRVGNGLYWDGGRNFDMFAFKQKNPAVLLDYTGFEDADGNKIYECDILEDGFNRRLLVEWHRGGFRFKAITETNFMHAPIATWFEPLTPTPELIGNAYENPEMVA